MNTDHDELAFPSKLGEGMTLRQYYAGQALAGILANPAMVHHLAGIEMPRPARSFTAFRSMSRATAGTSPAAAHRWPTP
jgi:hypothetical protein